MSDITVRTLKEFINKIETERGEAVLDAPVTFMFEHLFAENISKGQVVQFEFPLHDMAVASDRNANVSKMIVIGPEVLK